MRKIEKEYEIHYYEIDSNKKLTMKALMGFLEDLFVYHSKTNGAGFKFVEERNLSWVISQWDINMKEYPLYGEKILIKTYPISYKKIYLWKKYEIYNQNKIKIGDVSSSWILVNTIERKVSKIDEDYRRVFELTKDDEIITKMDKPRKIQNVCQEKYVYARCTDIDTNRHVNNITYLSWAFEVLPKDIIYCYRIENLKIRYYQECNCEEKINLKSEIIKEDNNTFASIHEIKNEEGNIISCIEIVWIKK